MARTVPIKNATSTSRNTFGDIQKTLLSHGATNVNFSSDGKGRIIGITFSMVIRGQELFFRMPARIENVERIFLKNSRNYVLSENQKEQAYRTAWANIRDWLAAQLALIQTEQVALEEIFLPFLLAPDGTTTYFEALRERQFLLEAPQERE